MPLMPSCKTLQQGGELLPTSINPEALLRQVIKTLQQGRVTTVEACPQPRICGFVAIAPHHSHHTAVLSAGLMATLIRHSVPVTVAPIMPTSTH